METRGEEPPSEISLPRPWSATACAAISTVVFFALSWFSLLFVMQPERVAGFWLPNGFLIGLMIQRERREWRCLLAGAGFANVAANLVAGNSLNLSLGFATANVLETGLAAWALIRYCGTPITLRRVRQVFGFVAISAVPACFCGSVLGSLLVTLGSSTAMLWPVWRIWFVADLVGMMLMVPLLTAWQTSGRMTMRMLPRVQRFEAAVLLLLICGMTALVSASPANSIGGLFFRPYLLVPLMLWAAMRFGAWGTALATLCVALVAVWFTAHGRGPFQGPLELMTLRMLSLQSLLAVVVLATLIMVAVLDERSRSQEQLELVIRGTDAGIWDWNVLTNEVYQSPRWKSMLGFEDHELPSSFEAWESRIHPEDHSHALATFRDYLSGRVPQYELEHRLRHRDGSYRWVLSRGLVVRDSAGRPVRIAGSNLDITALKLAQEALRVSERNFNVAFDNSPIGMDLVDLQGRFLRVNQSYCRMVGYTPAQLIGQQIRSITHPGDIATDQETLRRFLAGELRTYQSKKRYLHADGRVVWALLNITMVRDSENRPLHFFGQIQDISQLKQDEEELRQQALELKRSNQELDDFAYVASHDLKTPLRGIENLSKWIVEDSKDVLPEASREHLRKLRQRVARLDRLLDDLLQYSRAGRMMGDVLEINTGPLVRSVVELLTPPSGFVVVFGSDMPTLTTHKTPLELVFRNLIDNAIKHHHRNEGRIEVSAISHSRFVEFTVKDDGPGIPTEYHAQIFRMFQTLKPRDETEASGIGLAVVKKVVERQGGQVSVESREGQGTAFRFTWPKLFVQRGRQHA